MSFYDKEEPQSFVSRITKDTDGAYAALASIVLLASTVYAVVLAFLQMQKIYASLAYIMLSCIPISIISTIIIGKMQYKMEYIVNTAYSAITNFFGERMPNIVHIKTNNMEDEEYLNGIKASNNKYKADVKNKILFNIQAPLGTLAQYINQIVLLLVASALVRQGVMKMPQVANLYNYFLIFMGNAYMFTGMWQGVKSSHGACATIARLADTEDENLDDGMSMNSQAEDILFQDVCFSYSNGRNVIKNVSFVIPEGKVTAIVGENGSGKSTVIKMLERFNVPSEGVIKLGDDNISEINMVEWRDAIGYLSQGDQVVKGTIRDNITYGLNREYTEEELINAAKLANAYDFIESRENGFDTEISKFDTKCSGGQLQRLAIARIIMKNPQILIMDEATSGIDVVYEAEILQSLSNMMKGKTVIMISHNMSLIRKADNIVVLNDGVMECSGSMDQVSKNSDTFNKFMAVQTAAV
jgi:ATP-binding cassette subfamily B protein AbcA/BmrA